MVWINPKGFQTYNFFRASTIFLKITHDEKSKITDGLDVEPKKLQFLQTKFQMLIFNKKIM